MCFIKNNTLFFRIYNCVFAVINLAFFIAGLVTFLAVHDDWRPYYRLDVTHNQEIEVYPLYISMGMHLASTFFHLMFIIFARSIVENAFTERNTNPYRWFLQFVGEGLGLVGLMVIHGIAHIETLMVTMVVYGAVLILCYYQDEYLNANYDFMPNKEPHVFAIPIYILLIVFVSIKSTENLTGEFSTRVAIVSLISLFQTSLMFIIQRFHVGKFGAQQVVSHAAGDEGDDEGDKLDPIEDMTSAVRRGIFYEILQYTNTNIFMMVVSWLIISIVRNDVVLSEP
jgi:hypothetical protein